MTVLAGDTEASARRDALHWAASAALGVALLATVAPLVWHAVVPPPVPPVRDGQVASQEESLPERLRVGEGGDWAETMYGASLDETPRARFVDDVVLIEGEEPYDFMRTLVAIDRDSGEELWRFQDKYESDGNSTVDGRELSLGLGSSEYVDDHVYLEYQKDLGDGREEVGVLALSPRDGEVEWSLELGQGPEFDVRAGIEDLRDDQLLVNIADEADEQDRAVVVDTVAGEVVWEADDLGADFVTADLVVGFDDDEEDREVVAVDIAGGQRQWEVDANTTALAATDTHTVVGITGGLAIIDNATGDVVDRFTAAEVSCLPAEQDIVACQSGYGMTYRLPLLIDLKSEPAVRPCYTADDATATMVDEDRIFLASPGDEPDIMLDKRCNVVDNDLPGAVLDIADGHVLLADGGARGDSVRVHELAD